VIGERDPRRQWSERERERERERKKGEEENEKRKNGRKEDDGELWRHESDDQRERESKQRDLVIFMG